MSSNKNLLLSSRELMKISRESNSCLTFFIWLCNDKLVRRFSENRNIVIIDENTEKFLEGDGELIFRDYIKNIERLDKIGAVNVLDWDKGYIMINPYICYLGVRKDYLSVTELWDKKLNK